MDNRLNSCGRDDGKGGIANYYREEDGAGMTTTRRSFLRSLGAVAAGVSLGLKINFGQPGMFEEQPSLAALEMRLKRVIQECWIRGGDPTDVTAYDPEGYGVISSFTERVRRGGGVDAVVDVYVSDFGDIPLRSWIKAGRGE